LSDSGGPAPVRVGDAVLVTTRGASWPARVVAVGTWLHIVAIGDDGRLWMEVMNVSAVSWTRVVELSRTVDPNNAEALKALASAIAWQPRRTDVADVPGAERLLAAGAVISPVPR